MISAFAPAAISPAVPLGFGRFSCGGLGRPCPPPSGSPGSPSGPAPAAKWVRYASPGTQEMYARLYNVLREPSVLGVKVIPEEQADTLAKQLVDTILSVPQSEDLRHNAICALEDMVLKPLVIFGTVVGVGAIGYGIYRRRKRRQAGAAS